MPDASHARNAKARASHYCRDWRVRTAGSEPAAAALAIAQIRPNGLAVGSEAGLGGNAPVDGIVIGVVKLQLVGIHYGIHVHAFGAQLGAVYAHGNLG